ncbi:hypothetical protein [Mangrovibacterium sp.]|uniref:hypothetical protein n=1 Tax=Mangrovibacterium sp. TaxID=1961364 RepID=UPI0035664B95
MNRIISIIFATVFFLSANAQTTIYTNDMDYVLGDVKQAFIQDKITTQEQAQNLIKGLKNLGVNGIRVPIFAEGMDPNKPMFDYFYSLAVAEGFPIFANPAQSSGGQRIAIGILNGDLSSVKDDSEKTAVLINRIKDFAAEYSCKWINPFNEDGAPGGAWSASQMNLIYSSLKGQVNGAELIGPCAWGIPASTRVLEETTIADDITIAGTHNLGFNHENWDDFIAVAKAKNLPVWDSEVNHNDVYTTGSRLEVAVAAGVDGLVMYNIWNTIDLTTGAIGNSGKEHMAIYLKNMPALTPGSQIDGGDWVEKTSVVASAGSKINFAPMPESGTWSWSGPNDFTATTREISIDNIDANNTGEYVASYTSPEGDINHLVMTLALSCTNSPSLTSYYRIDKENWFTGTTLNLDEGSYLELGPQTSSTGSWIWSGPNGYTSGSRQITISDVNKTDEGVYTATFIDESGCGNSLEFDVSVNDTDVSFPDPDARYFIDCPEWNLRLGADGTNAFTTSTSATDYQVQWTVKESTNEGYYYIDCIGSVADPRIRTDRSDFADMTGRSSTGTQAKWSLTRNDDDTFFLSTTLDNTSMPRLQVNSAGEVRMVSTGLVDNTVKFTFTDIEKGRVGNESTVTAINETPVAVSELIFPGLLENSGAQFLPLNYVANVISYQLDIYTIQGQHIFTSNNMEIGWSPCQQRGLFLYRVSYSKSDGKLIRTSGKVYCNGF